MDLATFITQYILTQNDIKNLMAAEDLKSYLLEVNPRQNRNQLLIQKDGEEVFLGLQFEEKIRPLLKKSAQDILHEIPQNDLSIIVEEFSHLIYSFFNFQQNQPISHLELEVQAEIDRFVFFQNVYNPDWRKLNSEKIYNYFFSEFKLQDHIQEKEVENRYQEAHRLGKKACKILMIKGEASPDNALRLCQNLFRIAGHQKLDAIEKLKAA